MVGIKITGSLMVNGRTVGHSSPMEALKDDLVTEMGTGTKTLAKIDKLVVVDNNGNERDSTTSLSYIDNSPDNVQIKGTITISASYTVAKIRAYAGSKLYFETSYSVNVNAGDKLDITLTVTVSVSCSLSGSARQSSCDTYGFRSAFLKALIGASRPAIYPKKANLYRWSDVAGGYIVGLSITLALSYDTVANKVTGSGSKTSTSSFNAEYLTYEDDEGNIFFSQTFATPLAIYVNTTVNISMEFTVS